MADPTLDRTKLRRDAESATQEEWSYDAGDAGIDYSRPYSTVTADGGNITIAEVNNFLDDGDAKGHHIANLDPPTTLALLDDLDRAERERDSAIDYTEAAKADLREQLDRAEAALREISELAKEALEDEDFQPQFSQRNHMTGPALRGLIERIQDACTRAALAGEG